MNPQLTSNQVIEDFLQKLLEEAGMDTASPEVREQMFKDLKLRLNDRLFGTVIANLIDEKLTEFRQITEKEISEEELQKFIDANIPNAQEVFAQAMTDFRKDYLGLA